MIGGPNIRLPLLITGITGVAGFNAFRYFRSRYPGKVIGIRSRKTWRLNGDGIVPIETEDRPRMHEIFRSHRFGSVLNCTGNCALRACELDPGMAWRLNVEGTAVVVDLSHSYGSRLVHLSSDLVFSGTGTGGYVETDPPDPVTVYGKTMVEGESVLRSRDPSAAILRISLPMGPSFNRHAGAIDWIQSRFRHGRPATLYFDEVRSCTYVADLNRVFESFLNQDATGLFHAGGPRAVSLYQIAQIVNRVGGYRPDLLKGCLRIEAGPIPPRAGNVRLCSEKLHARFGGDPFHHWPLAEDLVPTDREWHRERPHAETHSFRQIVRRLYRYAPNRVMRADAADAGHSRYSG